ncbi:unnamed protein product [Boreogadus saida]
MSVQVFPGLILPETMKVFPVYMNSLMKTAPLVGSTELSTDDRSHQRLAVMAMGVEDTQLLLYPRLIPLHNMELEGEAVPLRCSEDRLSDGGAFLLENGHALFLWLGQACPPELIQGLFNLPSLAHLQPNTHLSLEIDRAGDTQGYSPNFEAKHPSSENAQLPSKEVGPSNYNSDGAVQPSSGPSRPFESKEVPVVSSGSAHRAQAAPIETPAFPSYGTHFGLDSFPYTYIVQSSGRYGRGRNVNRKTRYYKKGPPPASFGLKRQRRWKL